MPAFDALTATFARLHRYQHLAALAGWDQAAMMPPRGNEARAAALAELDVLMHRTLTDPAVAQRLQDASAEALDAEQCASLREMRRQWQQAACLPSDLVQAQSLASTRCEHAWRRQRPAQDWAGFAPNLREVVALARQEARLRADATGLAPYDALMDKFEPGMTTVRLDALFDELKTWLPDLIREAAERQRSRPVQAPQPPFDVAAQRALGLEVMTLLGFDFEGGRLDVSTHPFCGGVPEDVRITTRYDAQDFVLALMGVIHETGHARYEQGLPRALVHLPVGRARSMGIHESQSLSLEMQLARSPAFCQVLAPLLRKHLGAQSAFEPDALARLFTRVRPGFIRVQADELSYPAHVILRYELERADRGRHRGGRAARAVGRQNDGLPGPGHTGASGCGLHAGHPLALRHVWLLSQLHLGRDVRGAVLCCHAPPDARAGRARGAWRSGAGVRLAGHPHLAPGQPLEHGRTGRPRHRRGAQPRLFAPAPAHTLPGLEYQNNSTRTPCDKDLSGISFKNGLLQPGFKAGAAWALSTAPRAAADGTKARPRAAR